MEKNTLKAIANRVDIYLNFVPTSSKAHSKINQPSRYCTPSPSNKPKRPSIGLICLEEAKRTWASSE